jgi:hypothetical protein
MAPIDMSMKVKDKVSSFLYLHNNIRKNLFVPNVVALNMLRNNDDDDVNLGKTLSIASTTHGTWIQYAQDRSWSASSSKPNIRFVCKPTVLRWEDHNSSIRNAFEVNEHLMESLFDKHSKIYGPTSISYRQGL